jgi:tetratricopeptide (TPR) repeat protein
MVIKLKQAIKYSSALFLLAATCLMLNRCNSQTDLEALERYSDEGNFDQVISYSDSNPEILENERVRFIRANSFFEKRMYETALKEVYTCLKVSQNPDSETYVLKGRIEEGIGMIASAKDSYAMAMKIDPQNPTPYYRAGVIQYNSKVGLDTVLFFLNRSIELDDANPEAINFRGLVYGDLGAHQESLDDHLVAIQLDSLQSKYYFNASVSYFYLGNLEMAVEFADKSILLDVDNGMLYDSKAAIFLASGDTATACEILGSAIRYGFEPEPWFREICGI